MFKNRLQLHHVFTYLLFSIAIVTVFSIAELALYRLSFKFVVFTDFVSWYFPVGLRVVAFLLLPLRFWPALFIANSTGQVLHGWIYLNREYEPLWEYYLSSSFSQILPLLPLFVLKVKKLDLDITKVKNMTLILSACLFYRAVRTPSLLLSDITDLYAGVSADQKFEMVLAHLLAGTLTILYALLLCFVVKLLWNCRKGISYRAKKRFTIQLAAVLSCFICAYAIEPNVLYLLRLLAIFPLIWFAYRHGHLGCMIYALCISTLLLVNVYGVNQTDVLMTTQTYIINYLLLAFILAAFIAEHNKATNTLVEQNKTLLELNQLSHELAAKVVNAQESERKSLSQELHDEVGQNLTALKTYLKLADKEHTRLGGDNNQFIAVSMNAAQRIYDSVYDLMHWLRPRVIDELGLAKALKGEPFSSLLHNAGISFTCSITGDHTRLRDEQQVAIYRICQEAITNTIKHASSSKFHIALDIGDSVADLTIGDNGIGLSSTNNTEPQGGFGLQGIKERVLLLNGTCTTNSQPGFTLHIKLPLAD